MKEQVTRIACYAVVRDDDKRILLCRIARGERNAGEWTLPGGGIEFGEGLTDCVKREVLEETGFVVEVSGILDAHAALIEVGDDLYHAVRVVFLANVCGGKHRSEVGGSTDLCMFHSLEEVKELSTVQLVEQTVMLLDS